MSRGSRSAVITRAAIALIAALPLPSLAGCASFRTMTASPGDLDDYRAYRVAAAQGTRLARARRYLDLHPEGAFSEEVRASFANEEQRYFEAAQASREGVRRYLADLPDGPHAAAAIALLTAFASDMHDAELRDIARRVRYEDAKLEAAALQRRAVGEAILGAVGVLLDEGTYGAALGDAPSTLRSMMIGPTATTWGSVPNRREEDYYFVLPTRPERESRLLTLEIALGERDGVIASGSVEGSDMFVYWAEADQITKLDPSAAEDRTEAQLHAMDRLGGALERRFPGSTCPDARQERELFHRACGGWEVSVTSGSAAGDKDRIVIRGPSAAATAATDEAKETGPTSGGDARKQGLR